MAKKTKFMLMGSGRYLVCKKEISHIIKSDRPGGKLFAIDVYMHLCNPFSFGYACKLVRDNEFSRITEELLQEK